VVRVRRPIIGGWQVLAASLIGANNAPKVQHRYVLRFVEHTAAREGNGVVDRVSPWCQHLYGYTGATDTTVHENEILNFSKSCQYLASIRWFRHTMITDTNVCGYVNRLWHELRSLNLVGLSWGGMEIGQTIPAKTVKSSGGHQVTRSNYLPTCEDKKNTIESSRNYGRTDKRGQHLPQLDGNLEAAEDVE
jgi:hypothetical protein